MALKVALLCPDENSRLQWHRKLQTPTEPPLEVVGAVGRVERLHGVLGRGSVDTVMYVAPEEVRESFPILRAVCGSLPRSDEPSARVVVMHETPDPRIHRKWRKYGAVRFHPDIAAQELAVELALLCHPVGCTLTGQRGQVLRLLLAGVEPDQIADILGVARKTLRGYLSDVWAVYGAGTPRDLVERILAPHRPTGES